MHKNKFRSFICSTHYKKNEYTQRKQNKKQSQLKENQPSIEQNYIPNPLKKLNSCNQKIKLFNTNEIRGSFEFIPNKSVQNGGTNNANDFERIIEDYQRNSKIRKKFANSYVTTFTSIPTEDSSTYKKSKRKFNSHSKERKIDNLFQFTETKEKSRQVISSTKNIINIDSNEKKKSNYILKDKSQSNFIPKIVIDLPLKDDKICEFNKIGRMDQIQVEENKNNIKTIKVDNIDEQGQKEKNKKIIMIDKNYDKTSPEQSSRVLIKNSRKSSKNKKLQVSHDYFHYSNYNQGSLKNNNLPNPQQNNFFFKQHSKIYQDLIQNNK